MLHDTNDRREAKNRPLTLLVDTGLVCRFSLGENATKLLYLTHNIPSSVAARVLYHDSERRRTELEVAMAERGQAVRLTALADWNSDE